MRKSLPSYDFVLQCLLGFLCCVFLTPNVLDAQCGLSSFPGPGSPYTPTTTFQNTQGTGSGTYDDFNVTSGNIYSFYCTPTRDPSTLNYFDLTVSSTSSVIVYNNSVTPIENSWTGGTCQSAPPVSSTDWYANYTGTVRINVNSWNGTCHAWVAGQGSAVLSYKECVPSADPGPGNNAWNVEAFATTDITIPAPIVNARYGTYIDNVSGTSFVSTNYWAQASNPSTAAGWTGCEMPNNNFVVKARREGFPCSAYSIVVNKGVSAIVVYLNGTQIYTGNNITSAVTVGNYALSTTDLIEIRFVDDCSANGGVANVSIAPITAPVVSGGTIGGVLNNANICPGETLGNFTSVVDGSGGVSAYTNGGTVSYTWELSINGGSFSPMAGVTTSTWNSTTTVPAGSTYVIKRVTTDECGNRASSNTITVTGRPAPNGSITPASQQICPGTSATLTFNFNSGTAPFNISYTNSLTTVSVANVSTGSTISVSPPSTETYSFTSITDAYGCTTTSGFTGGALVIVTPPINISGITLSPVLCNGSSTGAITVNAGGGAPPLNYSLNGGAYQTSNTFSNLPAGSYNITVQDSLNCTQNYAANPVVLTQPTAVTATLAKTDASCTSVFNGTITVTASGGTPAYSYAVNGGPTQTNNVITGLQAGYYTITTFDRNGCFDTASITIGTQYAVALDTISTSDITCYGAGNGTLDVALTGGIAPYQYSINGISYQSSGSFTGLAAANYIVVGRDSKGCTQSVTVDITQPVQLLMIIDSITNVLCNSAANGNIYAHATGGTPGYTYLWSNGQTTASDLNIGGGTYNIIATDSRGCTAVNGGTVASPALLSLNIALFNNPFCNGTSSGAILVTANGGVAPYTYAWSSGQTTEDIDSVPAGVYTVSVSDANGCQQTISQTLTDPAAITSSVTSTNVSCAGANDGTASITAGGGTPPFTYLWSDFLTTPVVTGLAGGTYYVIATDHNGCQQRDSVTITEPLLLVVTDSVTNISCFNANDGSVALTVSGGTLPYGYLWSNGATTQNLSNLAGGQYCGTVTDANHCSVVVCVNVINPLQLQPVFVVKNLSCFGDTNGAINLTVSGGTPGYSYVWSTSATTANISGLTPATYYVTITDSRNCVTADSATVNSPGALYTSGILSNVTCHGLCNGYILTTPYGGTLPYTFAWSNGPSTENVIQLCGGSYYLTLTDANNCSVASLYIIHEPALFTDSIATTPVSCFGNCNGAVASIPNGGTQPYQYLWNTFGNDSLQSGLCAGHYTLMLTDSNGCHLTDTVDLAQPSQILVSGTITNAVCNGSNTGAVNLTVSGGSSPYTFNWSGGQTSENINNAPGGAATVTVTDAHSCLVSTVFNIGEPEKIHPTVSINEPRCSAGNDGFISVAVTGGVAPYGYGWNTSPAQSGATATNLSAGTYTLTITDSVGCSATVTDTIVDPTPVTVTTQGASSRCYNNPNGGVIATATGGYGPYTYILDGVYQTSDTFKGLSPATYVLLVMDANGCQATSNFVVGAVSTVSVTLSVTDPRILTGMQTQLSASATSDTTITHYFWSPVTIDSVDVFDFSGCGDTSDCTSPYVMPPFTTTFTVMVENADSCFATDTITVYVDNEAGKFEPTAFTPNGDGLNDRFALTYLGASKIEVTIYNRWGEKVYYNPNQTNNLNAQDGWDGTDHGKEAPQDTYVWVSNVTYFNGVVKNETGTVTLMR